MLPSTNKPNVLYTPDPELSYLQKISYPRSDYTGIETEDGSFGLKEFRAVTFNHDQAVRWCQYLAGHNFYGRSDWKLREQDAYLSLYNEHKFSSTSNALFRAKSWPTSYPYWSTSPLDTTFFTVYLSSGSAAIANPTYGLYTSCVSGR